MRQSVALSEIDESKLGPNSPLREIIKRRRREKSRDLEHPMQVGVFEWAESHRLEWPELQWMFAVPNFAGRLGKKTARHGARLKAEGRKPGVPDILLPVRRGDAPGLAIEMKAGKNALSPDQQRWLQHLWAQKWETRVCYSTETAIAEIVGYLGSPGR